MKKNGFSIQRPKTREQFTRLNNRLNSQGFISLDALKPGIVRTLTLGDKDPSINDAQSLAGSITSGAWSNGPLTKVAWCFDERDNAVVPVNKDGKNLGLGYVKWGPGNCTPSVIPVLAQALPYTAAPLRYIADLTAGLGPKLMYRFPDGQLVEFKDAGARLLAELRAAEKDNSQRQEDGVQEAIPALGERLDKDKEPSRESEIEEKRRLYEDWERTWLGYEIKDDKGKVVESDPGAKRFLEENNLNLHLSKCMQDDVMLDMYFPTVGFQRGRRGAWAPKIVEVSVLSAHSTRLEKCNEYRHINHVYFSDQWRTLGASKSTTMTPDNNQIAMYPAAMPEHLLKDLRYIVESNQRTRIKDRPTWVVCPTYYPSGSKVYYPQPAWWSIFTSKAYDFSSTILYDKAKQRENKTSWGRIMYISLDYLEQIFAQDGYKGNPEKQQQFVDELERSMEEFLQHRENNGKFMRQWSWIEPDGKEHENIKIVDIADAVKDEVQAGKDELELSTSPIFLALQVDPRLVGVPMVAASNGGTALREMHLLKQQQLNVKQRLYLQFLNSVVRFNEWDSHAEFHIAQQTLTTLDNSKTGIVESIAGEKA